jgi:nicotinate-nucleotide adenylyltransferase
MKIAILGGSFDPPHIGHLLVAQQVKKLLNIDQVWLMPTYSHPFQKSLIPAKHRLAMIQLLEDTTIKASDFEIQKQGVSYTIDTLKNLNNTFPQHSFYWISGSDQIQEFPKWKNWQELITTYKIIIYARNQDKPMIEQQLKAILKTETIPQTLFILPTHDLPTITISSSSIRERIKQNQSIRGLVPKRVEEYIHEHKLYE